MKKRNKTGIKADKIDIKAIIFDVDGVLIDSKRANYIYLRDTLKALGYREVSEKEYDKMFHKTGEEVVRTLLPDLNDEEYSNIRDYQLEVSPDFYKFAELNLGIKEILEFLRNSGFLLGVVTNRTSSARKILEFFGIIDYFSVVVGSHDVTNAKPHPEPILKAIKSLKVRPENSVYIGDSDTDVMSANSAGVVSIFYSDYENPDADFNIKKMEELKKIINP